MKGIQIKISGQWVNMPEDFSISLENTNPLFNEQGVFSFPFEIPLKPNRALFKNIADPFGDISLDEIDKVPAELWFDGIMLYRGIIEVDQEIELTDGIQAVFLSGNSDFMSRIENLKARDIPLDREIKLGYVVSRAKRRTTTGREVLYELPDFIMMNYTEYNVKDPYPIKPYCNVRLCASNEDGYYKILDAKRPFSGVCFYVMYLLDCLMKHLHIRIEINDLSTMEDMTRLAFFTTTCKHKLVGEERVIPLSEIRNKDFCGDFFAMTHYYSGPGGAGNRYWVTETFNTEDFTYLARDVYATNENFPDISIKDLIDDLYTAFGVRMIYDSHTNNMQIVYVKDILKSSEVSSLDVDILNEVLEKNKVQGIRLTYGQDNDISYDYNDYSNVVEYDNYSAILGAGGSIYDTSCKIDRKTGNAYRIKVNKKTGKQPVLFEVAGFRDYLSSKQQSKDGLNEMSISFKPITVNSILIEKDADGVLQPVSYKNDRYHRPGTRSLDNKESRENSYAVFVDANLKNETKVSYVMDLNTRGVSSSSERGGNNEIVMTLTIDALCPEYYDVEANDEPPLRNLDVGYMMGIMRGPGNQAGLEFTDENYDGEGNSSWTQTVGNYAFTSDSCDNNGRYFDYNGTEAGGADQHGRFSLKLIAGKDGFPIAKEYASRGLVSTFLAEYFYFIQHKKMIILTVHMSITQIIGINYFKKYKIGNYVGFINKVSYTLDAYGIGEVTIELYML